MKRSGFTLTEFVVVLFIICVAAYVLMPMRHGTYRNVRRSQCQTNLKHIGLGFKIYAQDYDDQLPLLIGAAAASTKAKEGAYGWADALHPYLTSTEVFHCPASTGGKYEPWEKGYSDYFFNRQVAEKRSFSRIKLPITVVLVGEGNDGLDTNDARYALPFIPNPWLKDESSPIYRHLDGSNYLYVDGHVKWSNHAKAPVAHKSGPYAFTFSP